MKKLLYFVALGTMLLLAGCSPTIEMEVVNVTCHTVDINYTYSGVGEDVVWLDAVVFDAYGHSGEFQFDIEPGEGKGTMHIEGLYPQSKVYVQVAVRHDGKPMSQKPLAVVEFDTKEYKKEAVDLGLSVMWYSENLGANGNPLNPGNYYAWGEVKPQEKGVYTYDTYTFRAFYNRKPNKPYPRWNFGYYYDAATEAMGREWRMPTHEEWAELKKMCECKIHKLLGGGAYLHVTGPSGNSIVLPCGEYKADAYLKQDFGTHRGFYWSSTLASIKHGDRYPYYSHEEAHSFWFVDKVSRKTSDCCWTTTSPRIHGLTIRPVCERYVVELHQLKL